MLCALSRPILFCLLSFTRLVPRLAPRFLRTLGLSAFGFSCLLLPSSVFAMQIIVSWDPPQNLNITGYRLYYGYGSGSYEGVLDVGMETTHTLTDLEKDQVYYFAVVAYDAEGAEGELSQEVEHNGPARDFEVDTDENDLTDQVEPDHSAADSEPVPEEVGEMEADELDTMPALEQDSEGDQATDRTEAETDPQIIPQSQLSIVSVGSEPLMGDGAAESAIDGRAETFWRTEMGTKAPVHPHELVIALGGDYVVNGLRYLPRQDGKREGMVARYSFYVSEDGMDWGKAVITGTFSRDAAEQEVTFTGKMGSFVRFVAHSEVNGKSCTTVAEIKVLGVR
jgi:F5/8 type C domain/Fibronectin type III domain